MSQASLLDQILSGENRDLQVLAASGLVPLAPEDLIPVQVGLAGSPDAEVAGKAVQSLQTMEPRLAADYLAELAGEEVLAFFVRHVDHPTMVAAILRRRDTPRPLLVELASKLPPDLQEVLILRQDAIIDEPRILVALETNPRITNYAKRRVWEYREHLLPRDKVPPKSAEEVEAEAEAVTEEEIREAVEEVTGESAATAADGKVDMRKLTADKVRFLPVPIRLKIAAGAPRELRSVLIRDSSTQVALAVLIRNHLPDTEVEQVANNRQVAEEVLGEIARHREWTRKYSIQKALVKNPKTNPAVAVKFVPRMTVLDLRGLARDKNVSEAVRTMAFRLYNARRT
ncbi:MAG TPA: hypothetical protein VGG06_19125 [Thermoanaerobaculia bacterium]|jgi:hypothetical protein